MAASRLETHFLVETSDSTRSAYIDIRREPILLDPLNTVAIYPNNAIKRHIEGFVGLDVFIDSTGIVKEVEIINSSDTILANSAREAAWKLHFRPAIGATNKPTGIYWAMNFHYRFNNGTPHISLARTSNGIPAVMSLRPDSIDSQMSFKPQVDPLQPVRKDTILPGGITSAPFMRYPIERFLDEDSLKGSRDMDRTFDLRVLVSSEGFADSIVLVRTNDEPDVPVVISAMQQMLYAPARRSIDAVALWWDFPVTLAAKKP